MKTANTRWEYTGTNSRRDWQIVKCWKLFVLLYANARGIVSLYLGILWGSSTALDLANVLGYVNRLVTFHMTAAFW